MKNHDETRDVSLRHHDYGDMGLFHPFWDDFFLDRPFRKEMNDLRQMMRTDIEEKEKGYEFKIEVPGFGKSDVNLSMDNGYLTISAQKNESAPENNETGRFLRRERTFRAGSRSFYVGDIDESAITAELKHGVLHVWVPKEKKIPDKKKIEIK